MIYLIKNRLRSFLFKNMDKQEIKVFSLLSAAFFFIIGAYWTIRSLKNAILKDTVGVSSIPTAKKLSVVAIICLLLVYSKLVDRIPKHRLFFIVCTFYSACFFTIAYLFSNQGFVNPSWLGFASYSIIESFGSVVVALFWTLVATTVDISSAKRGYAVVFASGQIGALLGTTLVTKAEFFGIPMLICISATIALFIPRIIKKFVMTSCKSKPACVTKKPAKTGLLEGVRLLATKPYLLGIFAIVAMYEIVVTIFDFQMQILANQEYGTAAYAAFNAFYGQLVTIIACMFAFFGTRFFIKKFGFRFCLTFFPIVVASLVCYFYMFPSLWAALTGMVTIKALSYGFNNPVKEIIYLPTSDDIKFKAKSWIEMFGNRSSKAGGATINGVLSDIPQGFVTYGLIISLSVVGVWLMVALLMGGAFSRLVKKQRVVK